LLFGNPGKNASHFSKAQPLQGCEQSPRAFLNPGFQSKPWADISQRFQRYSMFARTHEFSTFCAKPSETILLKQAGEDLAISGADVKRIQTYLKK